MLKAAIVPAIYDPTVANRNIWIETEACYKTVRRLAREEGLLVGISAGGNVHAALTIAKELHAEGREGVIVTVLCDGADKYLSEHFWDDPARITLRNRTSCWNRNLGLGFGRCWGFGAALWGGGQPWPADWLSGPLARLAARVDSNSHDSYRTKPVARNDQPRPGRLS